MKLLPTNFCPLSGNPCLENHCAWWDYAATDCAIVSIADSLTDVAAEMEERSASGS